MLDNRAMLIENMTDNLPTLRKKLKLTQEGLAQIIGSSRHSVMQIEAKKRKMTWNTFLALVFLFDNNKETAAMLKPLGIYTDALERIIIQQYDAEM